MPPVYKVTGLNQDHLVGNNALRSAILAAIMITYFSAMQATRRRVENQLLNEEIKRLAENLEKNDPSLKEGVKKDNELRQAKVQIALNEKLKGFWGEASDES